MSPATSMRRPETPDVLLQAQSLSKHYRLRRADQGRRVVTVLDRVDISLPAGGSVALIGRSGSGKSTLARCLALLEAPSSGRIRFQEQDLLDLSERRQRRLRPQIQLIFQDPAAAINPRMSVAEVLTEPLAIAGGPCRSTRRETAIRLMDEVGLDHRWLERKPLSLSGGQRQRLVIARALALQPRVLILDEAFSGLDLSLQAQIVNLLLDLQERHAISYLLISHDLGLVAHLAELVVVLDQGRVVEQAAPADLLASPQHPRTQALVESMRLLNGRL